jgi:hypothetical protein
MDLDITIKSGTFLLGVVGSAKVLYEISIGRQSRMREEYKFAKAFIVELNSNPDMHPYVLEKGCQALAGDRQLVAEEIKYLLSLQRPSLALRDYVLGRKYLEHLPNVGNLQIAFKKKYQGIWSRLWRKSLYISFYALFVFFAVAPVLLSKFLFKSPSDVVFPLILCLAVFVPYAWYSLVEAARIYRAEKLVQHQDKHTQIILLS